MRHLILSFLAGLLLSGPALAQGDLYLAPRLGYGTFQMTSMKEMQRTIIQHTQVNAKVVEDFSPYLQFGLGVNTDLTSNTRVGVFVERGSTGGRISYVDYSGEFRYDNLVNYTALGFLIDTRKPINSSPLSLVGGIELSGLFSRLRIESYTRFYEETDSGKGVFNSFGFGVKPFIGLERAFKNLPVQLTMGYLAGINGAYHIPGEPEQYLVLNNTNTKLTPDWNGFRVNLTVLVPVVRWHD